MLDSLEYRVAKGRMESYEQSADELGKAREEAQECLEYQGLVVIVTCDALLGGDVVQVIPFTSKQLEKRKQLAYCAFFPAGAFWAKSGLRGESRHADSPGQDGNRHCGGQDRHLVSRAARPGVPSA